MLIVHPHFHSRRTGVTSHVEAIVRALSGDAEVRVLGSALDASLPRIELGEVLSRARREPVLWHAHRNNELLTGLALRALAPKLKVVFTRHAAKPAGAYTKLLARRADARIALTEEVQRGLALPAEIVSHGVDAARFSRGAGREESRAKLGWPAKRLFGVVGRIREEKGQADFVAAVAPLLAASKDWAAVLVGRAAPSDAGFKAKLAEDGGPSLHQVGELEDAAPAYRALDVVVIPSRTEGFSLVMLEAMAAGACVVAAALPHFPRFIEHGVTGFLYPPGDVEALRERLRALMQNPASISEVGDRAARAAAERFDVRHEAATLLSLYRRVLG